MGFAVRYSLMLVFGLLFLFSSRFSFGTPCAHPMGTGCQGTTTDRVQNTTDLSVGAVSAICFYMALGTG